jgi:hypothetical protein
MAGMGHLPAYDATAIIGGPVGRSLRGGFGGVTDTTDASAQTQAACADLSFRGVRSGGFFAVAFDQA